MGDSYVQYYSKHLCGRRIIDIAHDSDEGCYGLVLDDLTVVWILRDPEGNGPGHLDIVQPKKSRKTK